MKGFRARLGTRLLIVALVAAAPAIATIVVMQSMARQRAQERTLADSLRLVRLAAGQQAGVFDGALRLLQTLAEVSELRATDPQACKSLLPPVLAHHPGYLALTVANADGTIFCSSAHVERLALKTASGRVWFERVMETRQTATGDYQFGPLSGKPMIVVAHPLLDDTGSVFRIVVAVIDLSWLQTVMSRMAMPPGGTLTLFDHERTVLARFPGDDAWIGHQIPNSPYIERLVADGSEDMSENTGLDGIRRLYATVPVQASIRTGLYIGLGIDRDEAFRESDRAYRAYLWMLGIVTLAGVSAAAIGTRFLVLRPVQALKSVTDRIAAGDLGARAQLASSVAGLSELGDAVNAMAGALGTREDARASTERELRQSEDRYRQTNEELIVARDRAMDASRAKSEFLANMSHEIRTPMNGIIGMTDLVLDSELTPDQRDGLATVQASANTLLSILNDILDFSKIESRKLELEAVPFSPRDAIGRILKPFALRAHQQGLELICNIHPNVPPTVVGDPTRLQQVLSNLVGNGLKFTERGHLFIDVREDSRTDGRTTLHFSVTDTGIGIPASKHDAIFQAFNQADGSTTRRFGGTGLGLTISASLVRLMGGRIWVDSEPGSGSTFHFTVSLDVADAPGLPGTPFRPPPLDVLIVDDNDVNRRILSEQVARWGMKPTVVAGGRAAIDAMVAAVRDQRPFTLVLLDANMPDIDGFAVAETIAATPALASATVMMLTSSGEYGDQARCAEVGIAAYLTKPVYAADLLASMERALGAKSAAKAATDASKMAPGTLAMAPGGTRIRVLLVEDNVVNQRVAAGLLTRRGHDVTIAQHGREALALLDKELFDVVLMDLQMPVMSGIEATHAIRVGEAASGKHIRIVAMTAHAMDGDRERCMQAGMDGYLSKPIDPQRLFAAVEQLNDAAAVAAVAVSPATRPAFDESALLARLAGDAGLMATVIAVFLEDCPVRLAVIHNAVTAGDGASLRAAAHALAGAAGNLSAPGLFLAAKALEQTGAEFRAEAVDAAWRELSIEADRVVDQLQRRMASADSQSVSR
jgi:signal transduction histidine kinase/CheY-like chemotaxis protein/HPt (histidine-containing phosphotransfer) domain-containing protein